MRRKEALLLLQLAPVREGALIPGPGRLAVAQRIETFPIGIANNVFFIVLFVDARLYADAGLQVVYIVLGVMGWIAWASSRRMLVGATRKPSLKSSPQIRR